MAVQIDLSKDIYERKKSNIKEMNRLRNEAVKHMNNKW